MQVFYLDFSFNIITVYRGCFSPLRGVFEIDAVCTNLEDATKKLQDQHINQRVYSVQKLGSPNSTSSGIEVVNYVVPNQCFHFISFHFI